MTKTHDLLKYPSIDLGKVLFPNTGYVSGILELNDGTLLCSCYDHNIMRIGRWSTEAGHHLINSFSMKTDNNRISCLMDMDNNTTFISGSMNTIKVQSMTNGGCILAIPAVDMVWCLLRLRNNSSFLCGMACGRMEERKLGDNYDTLHVLDDHSSGVFCLCELSNGCVVSGSRDKTLKVWNMNTKTVLNTLTGHSAAIWRVIELKMRRDKLMIASGSEDHTVRIWDVTTGHCLQTLDRHTNRVMGLEEMADGCLISGSTDHTIQVWNINNNNDNNNNGNDYYVIAHVCKWGYGISSMKATRDGSIVIGGNRGQLEVRKSWLR